MTVSDLIEKLKGFDSDLDIYFEVFNPDLRELLSERCVENYREDSVIDYKFASDAELYNKKKAYEICASSYIHNGDNFILIS